MEPIEGEGIEAPPRISLTKLEAGKSEVSSELPEGQEQAHIDLGEPSTAPFPHLTLALGYRGASTQGKLYQQEQDFSLLAASIINFRYSQVAHRGFIFIVQSFFSIFPRD